MCKITDDVLAKFVTDSATFDENLTVLKACRTDLEIANKVIIGLIISKIIDKAIVLRDELLHLRLQTETEQPMA